MHWHATSALVILDNSTGKIIGSSRYNGHDPARSEIEIGWTFLTRDYWGGRYNRELKQLMLTHAFTFVECVVFWAGQNNLRSRKAMEKIGATLREGTFAKSNQSVTSPHVIYEIRKNWFEKHWYKRAVVAKS